MMRAPKLVPNDSTRRLYSIRGVVIEHDVMVFGRWIFRKCIPIIRVQINDGQLIVFNNIMREQMFTPEGYLNCIMPILELGMTDAGMKKYPVGSKVGITFGYAYAADQLLTGATPLKVMKLQVMRPGVELDHELELY